MFEVGFSEILLILGLALLVLGPEKLPGLAAKVGRWTGRARAMARQLQAQLEQEVTLDELAKSKPMQSSSSQQPTDAPAPTATTMDPDLEHRTGPQEPWTQGQSEHESTASSHYPGTDTSHGDTGTGQGMSPNQANDAGHESNYQAHPADDPARRHSRETHRAVAHPAEVHTAADPSPLDINKATADPAVPSAAHTAADGSTTKAGQ